MATVRFERIMNFSIQLFIGAVKFKMVPQNRNVYECTTMLQDTSNFV